MSFIPHTEADRQRLLGVIGVEKIEDLYNDLPQDLLFPEFDLPPALSELEITRELQNLSEQNVEFSHVPSFLGAGSYNHFIPSVVDHILRRSEFYTAYTPYQPEISQGTLQAIYEFQSMICHLTGMDVANASLYDGATALAEAVAMALKNARGERSKIILAGSIHPHYRQVVHTYMRGADLDFDGERLVESPDAIAERIDSNTAIVAVQYPDFFGRIWNYQALADEVHEQGALFCMVINPTALGLLKPPSQFDADIVVGEGQPLGISPSFGGPYLGLFATREKFVRLMPGRLVGETKDAKGQRGFVMTLTPREQHIRRERAASNICTNQGLLALAAAVYMSSLGRGGLRKVAELCYHKAHYLAAEIDRLDGYEVVAPTVYFHEFVVRCSRSVGEINSELVERGLMGGYDLGLEYPSLAGHMLLAVTEKLTRADLDRFVRALQEIKRD